MGHLLFLISLCRFGALEAVIINKAMSLVVVMSALPFRTSTISLTTLAEYWPVIANLPGGSPLGAWFGAAWATKLRSDIFYRLIAALLVGMAVILMIGHSAEIHGRALFAGPTLVVAGLAAAFAIGVVASQLGVARGELLIPTLIILFGVDVKVAGSLSLVVSLSTMLAGFIGPKVVEGRCRL